MTFAHDYEGSWVHSQRCQYKSYHSDRKKGRGLTAERIKLLDSINFNWEGTRGPQGSENKWQKRLKELKRYKTENGHCLVPQKYPSNQQLANWVKQQRTHYRFLQQGKYSSLTDERLFLLDSIGFVWKTKKGEKHKHISTTSPINNDEASKPSEEVKEASATLSLLARQDDTAETRPTYAASVFFSAAEPLPDPLSELLYTSLHGL